jgi:hypothetical protein
LSDAGATKTYAGQEQIGGVRYDVVSISALKPAAFQVKVFVESNGMVGRIAGSLTQQNKTVTCVSEWKEQKLNAVPASFGIALPADAKRYKAPTKEEIDALLVAVGKDGPGFALPTPIGGKVSLSDAAADHKAVLINFWFYG